MMALGLALAVRRAIASDDRVLREIAVAAKATWGYDRRRVDRWAETLRLFDEAAPAAELYVAEENGTPVAWTRMLPADAVCVLEDLWVEPASQRCGVGSTLFRFAMQRAQALGARWLEWEAEPHAIGFYERMGGRHISHTRPNEWGRVLPVMAIDLSHGHRLEVSA